MSEHCTTPVNELRVLMRFPTVERAVASAAQSAQKYGQKFAVIEDRDPAGGGDAYPYAVVTPYQY